MNHIIITVVQDILWTITGLTVLNALWYVAPRLRKRRSRPASTAAQAVVGTRQRNSRVG
jgi:hypothetical protein